MTAPLSYTDQQYPTRKEHDMMNNQQRPSWNEELDWDDPQIATRTLEFVKFVEPGQKVEGQIIRLRKVQNYDKTAFVPQLSIRPEHGGTKVVSCENYDLRSKVAGLRPVKGDFISITFVGTETLDNGNTLKRFEVTKRAGQAAPVEQTPSAPVAPVQNPAPTPAPAFSNAQLPSAAPEVPEAVSPFAPQKPASLQYPTQPALDVY